MITENRCPTLLCKTMPLSDADAEARISNCCCENGLDGLYGLTFKDIEQFQRGLLGTGLVGKIDGAERPMMRTSHAITYQLTAIGSKDFSSWRILLSQPVCENCVGLLEVVNIYCKDEGVKKNEQDR